jgi:hypothetical protein
VTAPERPPSGRLLRPLPLIAVIVLAVHLVPFGRYISDDAGITFAYAKNLAQGHGLTLNPGTDPVEGYSSFAWLVTVLPFCARGSDPTWGVKIFSFLLSATTLMLLSRTGDQLFVADASRASGHIRDLAAVALAAFTPFVVWTAGGMENPLYCVLLAAALYLYAAERFSLCALTLLGLALTRVEALAFVAVFAVHRIVVLAWRRQMPSRRGIAAASLFVAGYAVYLTWHWLHFRAFYPNSYLSKAPSLDLVQALSSLFDLRSGGWTYFRAQLMEPYHLYWAAPILALAFVGAGLQAALPGVLAVTAIFLIVLTGGDFYPELRLGTVLLPLLFLLLGEGTRRAVARVRNSPLAFTLAVLPFGLVCYPSLSHSRAFNRPIDFNTLRTSRADFYQTLARDVGENQLIVVESDIGNVAYLTDFPIIDLGGLANLNIARFGRHFLLEYIFDEIRPDVIHVSGTWAFQADIPFEMIQRDYTTLEGGKSAAGYAEGTFLKRTLANRTASQAAAAHAAELSEGTAAMKEARAPDPGLPRAALDELFRRAQRYCVLSAACTDSVSVSKRSESIADRYQRVFQFSRAFDWYSAAVRADSLNVHALRNREDMRLASAGPAALLERRRFSEARAFYEELLAKGWRPGTARELADVRQLVTLTGLRVPSDLHLQDSGADR